MNRLPYEKPAINPHHLGLANKFGRTPRRHCFSSIDDVQVTDLVERFGSPLYVFSEANLRRAYRSARQAFALRFPSVQFAWSYKTSYLDSICRIFHDEGSWAEVVSEVEYGMARRLGVPGNQILFNGPYKPESALRTAVDDGAKIHVDHFDELSLLDQIATERNRRLPIALRVNMDVGGCENWDRFGFNYESGEAFEAIRRLQKSGRLELEGLHSHIGTFVSEPSAYGRAASKISELALASRRDFGVDISYLDLGGGFASSATLHGQYYPGVDTAPAIEEYAEAISSALHGAGYSSDNQPTLILESGRALIDEAGFLITSVVGNKRLANGARGIVVDAGVNVLFTSFWYRHDVVPAIDRDAAPEETTIYGPLCMNIDVIRPSVSIPPPKIGDPLVVSPVGAYNFTQSMQFIRLRPNVILIGEGGQVDVIRRAETIDDVKGPESCPERLMR